MLNTYSRYICALLALLVVLNVPNLPDEVSKVSKTGEHFGDFKMAYVCCQVIDILGTNGAKVDTPIVLLCYETIIF